MIERPELQDPNWATKLASAQVGYVTEQTGAWVRFDLEGPGLERVLQRLANVDSARWVDSVAIRLDASSWGVCGLSRIRYLDLWPAFECRFFGSSGQIYNAYSEGVGG